MKTKWTKQFGAFTPGYASTMRISDPETNEAVCDVFWGMKDSSYKASLISHAPEMFECLESLVPQIDNPLTKEHIMTLLNQIKTEGYKP
jgi:hypothetical protein